MADEGPCCGYKKKTVVMSCIGLCCLMLVIWTVIMTATDPMVETIMTNSTNTTANSTMLGVCPLNSSLPLDRVSMALTIPKIGTNQLIKKIKIGSSKTHCKCLCQFNVTESEIIEALREVRIQRNLKKNPKNL
eukprot:GFUD01054901.1.p1 GENE.GFUD01054901.1~~GFUD01054901.1.p1  ORF type:complete len:155 (+),score=36.75 GFUD01054901.1:69-467(+)